MRTKAKQSLKPEVKKLILELLQNEGKCNYSTIEDYLKIKGKELKGKFLNKILQQMIEEDKNIERLPEKPRAVYRIRLDTDKILEIHGTYYKEHMRNQFIINLDNILIEITKKNKVVDKDQNYLKSYIEFLGLYVFSALMESIGIMRKMKEKDQSDVETYKMIHTWLSSALSLEDGLSSRSSLTFERLMKDFKKTKKETNQVTQGRLIETLKKLYPQTSEIFLNMGMKSDEFLDIVKEQKFDSLSHLQDVFGIISGKTNKATREKLTSNAIEKKLAIKFNSV